MATNELPKDTSAILEETMESEDDAYNKIKDIGNEYNNIKNKGKMVNAYRNS
jgi:hypothetical protein